MKFPTQTTRQFLIIIISFLNYLSSNCQKKLKNEYKKERNFEV